MSDGDVVASATIRVQTVSNAGSISPGLPYYIRVAAINDEGVGPALKATPLNGSSSQYIIPSSKPGLPRDVFVFAVPSSGNELFVSWRPGLTNGAAIDRFDIEYWSAEDSTIQSIHLSAQPNRTEYNALIPVTQGLHYTVQVRQENALGPSPPMWYELLNDVEAQIGAKFAVPACLQNLTDCTEQMQPNHTILARMLPDAPRLTVPRQVTSEPQPAFSKNSVTVFIAPPQSTGGDNITYYWLEWDRRADFTSPHKQNHRLAAYTSAYEIHNLTMGKQYFVRVAARTSAGLGSSSNVLPIVPMQQPDPPTHPIVSVSEESGDFVQLRSLIVSWGYPHINNVDKVGDGGDSVSQYLIEWSKISFDDALPPVQQVYIPCSGVVTGSFQLGLNTSTSFIPMPISYSATVNVSSVTAETLDTVLSNMPNIANLRVSEFSDSAGFGWLITFVDEVYNIPLFDAVNVEVQCDRNPIEPQVSVVQEAWFPSRAAYTYHLVDVTTSMDNVFAIQNLLPGLTYFVRIAAGNALGFGPRRVTAPESQLVPISVPGVPTSWMYVGGNPSVQIVSDTSVYVKIGPPAFDGGSLITHFNMEWDVSPEFQSGVNLQPLGSRQIAAQTILCTACVQEIAVNDGNVVFLSAEAEIAHRLVVGDRVCITTPDDNLPYTFVVSGNISSLGFMVQPDHFRDVDFVANTTLANVLIMGASSYIDDLEPNTQYYFRVSAENAVMGAGKFIATEPKVVIPQATPLGPSNFAVHVLSKNALSVTWSSSPTSWIEGYRVDLFQRAADLSQSGGFFGASEVQVVNTANANVSGGTFTLAWGRFVLGPGVVSGQIGSHSLTTTVDLTVLLEAGDAIQIDHQSYIIAATPASPASIVLTTPLHKTVYNNPFYIRHKSLPIPYNCEATTLGELLQNIISVGQVTVQRTQLNAGYIWAITFDSCIGDIPELIPNNLHLYGSTPDIVVTTRRNGVKPNAYQAAMSSTSDAVNMTVFDNLITGVSYFVRMLAWNERGAGKFTRMLRAVPAGKPGKVSSVSVGSLSSSSLSVVFTEDADDNGNPVHEYLLEYQTANNLQQVITQPSFETQEIITGAHTPPFLSNSTFTISTNDFFGGFLVYVGEEHFMSFDVEAGSNVIKLHHDDGSSVKTYLVTGDYIKIGSQNFRVCMPTGTNIPAFTNTTIPLCRFDDPHESASFHTPHHMTAISQLPCYKLDTALGAAVDLAVGDDVLQLKMGDNSDSVAAMELKPGDYVRVGDPNRGETFRVHTDTSIIGSNIPLGMVSNPSESTSTTLRAVQASTYEIQRLTFSIANSTGFRIRFRNATTSSTVSGGDPGCMLIGSDASAIRQELLALQTIDDLAISFVNSSTDVIYTVTFTGFNVRGNVPLLEVVDMGENGCFAQAEVHPTVRVETLQVSTTTVYRLQTTQPIPYDASARDVQSALEALPSISQVMVSRAVRGHGFAWAVTYGGFPTIAIPLVANAHELRAVIGPTLSITALIQQPITNLSAGLPYTVRVSAVNAYGHGEFQNSSPKFKQPSNQIPQPPQNLVVDVLSPTTVNIEFSRSLEDGGAFVSSYIIQYDISPSFDSGIQGEIEVLSSNSAYRADVERILLTAAPGHTPAGSFVVEFRGQRTDELPVDISADELEQALESLSTISDVSVHRDVVCSLQPGVNNCQDAQSLVWLITFIHTVYDGNQHAPAVSKLDSIIGYNLQVSGEYLYACKYLNHTDCTWNSDFVTISTGFVNEKQGVILCENWSITLFDQTISSTSISSLQDGLENIAGVGHVVVEISEVPTEYATLCTSPAYYTVIFYSISGDVPLMQIESGIAFEIQKGRPQFLPGQAEYHQVLTVDDFEDNSIFVRVAARNTIGQSEFLYPDTVPIKTAARAPGPVTDINVITHSSTSCLISWNAPISNGGYSISSFLIEYDTNPSFVSYCAEHCGPLGSLLVSADTVDMAIARVLTAQSSAVLAADRKKITISDLSTPLRSGDSVLINQRQYTIHRVVGDVVELSTPYTGTKIVAGYPELFVFPVSAVARFQTLLDDLTSGIPYYIRVSTISYGNLTSGAWYLGAPGQPRFITTYAQPTAPRASIHVLPSQSVYVEVSDNTPRQPEGDNGLPLQNFVVDMFAERLEQQLLTISPSCTTQCTGGFMLALGGYTTRCVALNEPARSLVLKLEELPTVHFVRIQEGVDYSSRFYNITFYGHGGASEDVAQLVVIPNGCGILDTHTTVTVSTLVDGVDSHIALFIRFAPMQWTISLAVGHFFYGYEGRWVALLHDSLFRPITVSIAPGSQHLIANQSLDDYLAVGMKVEINGILVEIINVNETSASFYPYHRTGGSDINVYVQDTLVGIAEPSAHSSVLVFRSWCAWLSSNFTQPVLLANDQVVIVDCVDGYCTTDRNISTSLRSVIPVYRRQSTTLSHDISATNLAKELNIFAPLQKSTVRRFGPTKYSGYLWEITMNTLSGKSLDSRSFGVSDGTLSALLVDCGNYSGIYVLQEILAGRPWFRQINSPYSIHADGLDHWGLYSGHKDLIAVADNLHVIPDELTFVDPGISESCIASIATHWLPTISAQVHAEITRHGRAPGLMNRVFHERLGSGTSEVQSVTLTASAGSQRCPVSLDFMDSGLPVFISLKDSADDFQLKFESLPTVGSVEVRKQGSVAEHQVSWIVTFTSFDGDAPLINASWAPSTTCAHDIGILVTETRRGKPAETSFISAPLPIGSTFTVAVSAENAAGEGASSASIQSTGHGAVPFSDTIAAPPIAPKAIGVHPVSATQLGFHFQLAGPETSWSNLLVEYTSAPQFSTRTLVSIQIYNMVANDTIGTFIVRYRGHPSIAISFGASSNFVGQALADLLSLSHVEVVRAAVKTSTGFGFRYDATIIGDIKQSHGNEFTIDYSQLRSNLAPHAFSGETLVEEIHSSSDFYATVPIYTSSKCARIFPGEASNVQVMTIATPITSTPSGSFRMDVNGERSHCINVNVTAAELKSILESLFTTVHVLIETTHRFDNAMTYKDFHIYFDQLAATIPAPTIYIPAVYNCRSWPSWNDSCIGGTSTVSVGTTLYSAACTTGRGEVQAIFADAKDSIHGSFGLYFQGKQSSRIDVDAPATTVQAELALLTGYPDIQVSKVEVSSQMQRIAWLVTFPAEAGEVESLVVGDQHLIGDRLAISTYPLFNLTFAAAANDVTGHFKILLGKESTTPLSYHATNGKVLQALHNLSHVGNVVMMHDDAAIISSLMLDASIVTSSTLAIDQDISAMVAVGDHVRLAGNNHSFVITDMVSNNSVTIIHLDHMMDDSYVALQLHVVASIGERFLATRALPGRVSVLPLAIVVEAIPFSTQVKTTGNATMFSIGQTIQISGQNYEVASICGHTCIELNQNYTGTKFTQNNPGELWPQPQIVQTTRDLRKWVSIGDSLIIGSMVVSVVDISINSLHIVGDIETVQVGVTAFQWNHGYTRPMLFRTVHGPLQSLRVLPLPDTAGTGLSIETHHTKGVDNSSYILGSLAEIQTITLRAKSRSQSLSLVSHGAFAITADGCSTGLLPWGLSASNLTIALEALATIDRVSVSRSGDMDSELYSFGYSYTITFWGDYGISGPPRLDVDTELLPGVVAAHLTPQPAIIDSRYESRYIALAENTSYAVRLRAMNSMGSSLPSNTMRSSTLSVAARAGSVTSVVFGAFATNTSLSLSFEEPLRTGGAPITAYRIELDSCGEFNPNASDYMLRELALVYEVQEIVTSFRNGDNFRMRGGSFQLHWGGRTTSALAHDITATELEIAIENLIGPQQVAIPPVAVSRSPTSRGFRWLVTFQGVFGNVGLLHADGDFLQGDDPRIYTREIIAGVADIAPGSFSYEVQTISVESAAHVSGNFTLWFEGYETDEIAFNATALDVQTKLESIPAIFTVDVTRDLIDLERDLFAWTVTFTYLTAESQFGGGDLPLITAGRNYLLPYGFAQVRSFERIKGTSARQVNLEGLLPGHTYFARITPYNNRGYGRHSVVVSAVTDGQPLAPSFATVTIAGPTALLVSWRHTARQYDRTIDGYLVEWCNETIIPEIQTITTSAGDGIMEIQSITADSDENNLGGYFVLKFKGETSSKIKYNAPAEGSGSVHEALSKLP